MNNQSVSKAFLYFVCSLLGLTLLTFYTFKDDAIIQFSNNVFELTNSYFSSKMLSENTGLYHNKTYQILYWTTQYSNENWFGLGYKPFEKCQYSQCFTSKNRSMLNKSDAILVHMRSIENVSKMPPFHLPNQTWIMYTRESPVHSFMKFYPFVNMLNLTLTYKSTSDITWPYVQFERIKPRRLKKMNYAKGRTKMIAWIVSNCRTSSGRERYVEELQKHIKVDIYGHCGTLRCSSDDNVNKALPTCTELLSKNYKFYLAFENSLCRDYITEKVKKTFLTNLIPIVLGGANYHKILPPNSYINVRDFTSPKELAKYLKVLDKNDTLYNKYFEWKKHYQMNRGNLACKLCEYLHINNGKKHYAKDLYLFWNKYRDCNKAKHYYKGIAEINTKGVYFRR